MNKIQPLCRCRTFDAYWALLCILSVVPTMLMQSQLTAQTANAQAELAQTEFSTNLADPVSEAADVSEATHIAPEVVKSDDLLRFSFNGTPWREVIRWIADQGDLALHVGDLPPGSFTYSDPKAYTSAEAIERINLFLLSEGFTLVRSDRLLSLINLGDPRGVEQLQMLAKQVSVDQLDSIAGNHDVIKCLFALGDIDADEAVDELSALNLMSTPTVLSKTNQLMITDTVAKLRNVREILQAFEPNLMDNGTVVKTFSLKHVEAEDVLLVARPHLGLATGEMIGIDVSLSSDLQGKHIFATGVEDKVKLIERLVEAIDRPEPSAEGEDGEMELRSHLVEGGNVDVVYNVLQTLLSGKTVRLSIDHNASSVVALASASVQNEIAATVKQIQSSDAAFEIIPLKNTDPYFVITLLEQMLDLPGPLTDPDDLDPSAPKIDADPGNRRLFVRAKQHQIDQIKKIVEGLESSSASSAGSSRVSEGGDEVRVLAIKGRQAERLLETAATFWRASNPVIVYPTSDGGFPDANERVPGKEPNRGDTIADQLANGDSQTDFTRTRQLTTVSNTRAPVIRCQVTSRGLLLQSDDVEALDRFEEHLRVIAGPIDSTPATPVVFYLQHTKPEDALRMLGELLDGGQSAREGEAGSLVNGFVSGGPSGAFLSSMVSSREGTTTMMAGTITVVADSRLNRVIAQGSAEDIELIEGYLKIIDKDQSITTIETHGRSKVIELLHTNASEVADSIRAAFAGRVAEETSRSTRGEGGRSTLRSGGEEQRDPGLVGRAADGGDGGKGGGRGDRQSPPMRDLAPKMTVAVHEPSNSLIVTAPEQLLAEVEELAKEIDGRGEQAVEVITPMNSEVFGVLLQQLTSGKSSSDSGRSNRSRDSQRSR